MCLFLCECVCVLGSIFNLFRGADGFNIFSRISSLFLLPSQTHTNFLWLRCLCCLSLPISPHPPSCRYCQLYKKDINWWKSGKRGVKLVPLQTFLVEFSKSHRHKHRPEPGELVYWSIYRNEETQVVIDISVRIRVGHVYSCLNTSLKKKRDCAWRSCEYEWKRTGEREVVKRAGGRISCNDKTSLEKLNFICWLFHSGSILKHKINNHLTLSRFLTAEQTIWVSSLC